MRQIMRCAQYELLKSVTVFMQSSSCRYVLQQHTQCVAGCVTDSVAYHYVAQTAFEFRDGTAKQPYTKQPSHDHTYSGSAHVSDFVVRLPNETLTLCRHTTQFTDFQANSVYWAYS